MPTGVLVNVDPARLQVEPGAKGLATVTIRNRSEEVAHYLLQIEGLPSDWAEIVPNQVSAFPLQETRAQMVIHPPAGVQGATYHLTIRATAQEDSGTEGRSLLDVDVPAAVQTISPPPAIAAPPPTDTPRPQSAEQIEIRAERVQDTKLPRPAAQWRLHLRNAGAVLDTFGFNITGIRPSWVTIEPAAVTLKPGEEGNALLTVRPGSDTPGNTYRFKLRTFSHLNLSQRTELALELDIRSSTAFTLSLAPRDAESPGVREFKVTLASDVGSNTDLWLDLTASDHDGACDYTFEPSQIFLPAKQTINSTLRVVPHVVLGANERKTHTITIVATPRNGLAPRASDEVRLTQVGAAPLSLTLRPQIQSGEMSADYTLTVVNPSPVQANISFAGQDPADACEFQFQPPRVAVPPNGQVQVTVRVQAHTGYQGDGQQEVPFTLSTVRVGELVPAARVDGKFTQLRLQPIALFLIPPQQSQPSRARYIVKVRNPRAAAIHLWLDARDDEDALAFAFQPQEMHLSGGAEGISSLVARPKDRLPKEEQRRVIKFTVTANVDGAGTTAAANGTLAQIHGTDWTLLIGRGLQWTIVFLKWALILAALGFAITVALAGTDRAAQTNPQLGRMLYSIISPALLQALLRISPFTGPAQAIVYLVESIMNVAYQPRR